MDEPKAMASIMEKKTAAAAPVAEKKAIEVWAEAKGYLPNWIVQPGIRRGEYVIEVPPKLNLEYWKFAAAKGGENWAIGAEVSEEEFDAAIVKWTVGHRHG
jgi:hypothetical protein